MAQKPDSTDTVRIAAAAGGVRVSLSPIGKRAARGARAGARSNVKARAGGDDVSNALLAALGEQELRATHEFVLQTSAAAVGRRGVSRGKAGGKAVSLDVDVGPAESAAVLVEQNGEFSWHFPKPRAVTRRGRRSARAAQAASATSFAPSTVRIDVQLPETQAGTAPRRGVRRGIGAGAVAAAARGIVLKFVARTAAGVSMKLLERNVKRGLVVMDGHDPAEWRRVDRIDQLDLPANRPARILLWLHGTFSNTVGSFGALAAHADGRALLDEARQKYDVVLGFDHATLSEDPNENAIDLIERLGRFQRPMHIDAVTYSRGGLVYRSLVEQLLPTSSARPELGPVVFVAVPNNGTLLAEPENWHTLIDLYTNLAAGAFRVLQLMPQAAPSARILAELVSGIGAFAKYLADAVVTEHHLPGLAAQEPGGEFVINLNKSSAEQPMPDSCRYLAITSNFDPRAAVAQGQPTGLAPSLLTRIADGLVDKLMKENNDLVVNGGSMKQIDPDAGNFIDASLDFGDSRVVYHTVYFAQPQVAQQLRGWLLDDVAREGMMNRHGTVTINRSPRSPFTRIRFKAGHNVRRATAKKASTAATSGKPQWNESRILETAKRDLDQLFGVPRPAAPPSPTGAMVAQPRPSSGRRAAARAARSAGVPAPGTTPRNYAPTLVAQMMQRSPISAGRELKVMSYTQTHAHIPIFGTRAVVELNQAYEMVASSAKLARVDNVSPQPTITPEQALEGLARYTKMPIALRADMSGRFADAKADLTFYHDRENDIWHLAYIFKDVPVPPPSNRKTSAAAARGVRRARPVRDGHGLGPSPRQRFPMLDYLVDAHDGSVVYYYSTSPTAARKRKAAAAPLKALPGFASGLDDEDKRQTFFATAAAHGFLLEDPQRAIRTFDLNGGDIDLDPLPHTPITSKSFDFGPSNPAGVSAHVNSSRVFDFYNTVLFRKGVDDQGTELINVVNVVSSNDEDPPVWNNAVWWKKRMWYGRTMTRRKFQSYARYLDIIGHELTHGVTETTSNLVYRDEAGALNESFSDIFGVIIKNWFMKGPESDPRGWDWIIGQGLGEKKGAPLRSMKDPTITGDPDHMNKFVGLQPGEKPNEDNDYGGVHTNSNIHNKAAYNLLTSTTKSRSGKAQLLMQPSEVARLYYLTLQRLDRVATFEDVFHTMLHVAEVVYPDPDMQAPRLAAIREAYRKVGIPREVKPISGVAAGKAKRTRTAKVARKHRSVRRATRHAR